MSSVVLCIEGWLLVLLGLFWFYREAEYQGMKWVGWDRILRASVKGEGGQAVALP